MASRSAAHRYTNSNRSLAMRRELFALAASALGVTLLASPGLVSAQETPNNNTITVNPQPASPPPQEQQPAAQGTVVVEPTPEPARTNVVVASPREAATESEETTTVPNSSMIVTGALTFGISYGVGAFAGAESDRASDRRLYVPLLGPWLALADRDPCPVEQQS
jgi:hypothetical protein